MLNEFDIIRTCFDQPGLAAQPGDVVRQGIGDDCALLRVPPGKELAFSMDTLVEGVHFPAMAEPDDLGWRALAVNLSDLAAAGATPLVFTLGLTLPSAQEAWLQGFAGGLREAAGRYGCALVGGDLTRGPLTITIQVHGLVDEGKAISRAGARPGDSLYVSGSIGGAALGLQLLENDSDDFTAEEKAALLAAFWRPQPRVALGAAVAGLVTAGIDISDGLLADLAHICERSRCGAALRLDDVPFASTVPKHTREYYLQTGDDYELLLTVSGKRDKEFLAAAGACGVPVTRIGEITTGSGVDCLAGDGSKVIVTGRGYQHFHA